jgi:hypothetical protein
VSAVRGSSSSLQPATASAMTATATSRRLTSIPRIEERTTDP